MVKSYISAICSVLQDVDVTLHEDRILLTSLTKACRLRNTNIRVQLPIQKSMMAVLLNKVEKLYPTQPYLIALYKAFICTAYYGLFRVGELTKGDHPVLARNVQIGKNKNKMLFILRTSKTHWIDAKPQLIKIASSKACNSDNNTHCPFQLLRIYLQLRGMTY